MKTYEIWNKKRYLYTILPSDGDPFQALEREQRQNRGVHLVEVENGNRTRLVDDEPIVTDDDEYDFTDWQSDEF